MSSDGRIVIDVAVDNRPVQALNSNLDQLENRSQRASSRIRDIVTSLGLMKAASVAINAIKSSMDAAISRFDTMNKFPTVMKALGFSAEESNDSIQKLSKGIDGLPTRLDEVVGTTNRMASVTNNLRESTDATIALNNAMLASGSNTADASRGMEQYIQMLSVGKVDLEAWKTLQETMPVALQKTAEAMGFTGQTAQRDLYEALKSGDKTFKDFQDQLIELGTGTGILADLARKNSEGIATSFGNLRNAVGKGLANILTGLDNLSKEVTGKSIAKNLDSLKVIINNTFSLLSSSLQYATPLVKAFVVVLSGLIAVVKPLTPAIIGLVAAYTAFKVIQTVNGFFKLHLALLNRSAASTATLTILSRAQTAAIAAETGVRRVWLATTAAQNSMLSVTTVIVGLLTGKIALSTVATIAWSAAVSAFRVVLAALTGPIGWVVAGIGALVTAGIALFKWLNKESEASKKLKKEQEGLASSTQELNDSVKQNNSNRKQEISYIESSSKAYQDLASKTIELSNIEKKSSGQKRELKDNVEQLNNSIAGLNLKYDEESGKLSMNTEQIKARIDAYKEQETANIAQQELVTILQQQHDTEARLSETNALRAEWNKKLEEGSVKTREHKKAVEELDLQEKTLKETQKELQTEHQNTQAILTASQEAIATATESGVLRQTIQYEFLSESQRQAVDSMRGKWQEYQDSATNMFDVLSDEQKLSVQEMQANLAENTRIVGEWGTNIATLAERGLNEGLLNKLREAGPESAGYVAALVTASDEQLQNLNTAFATAGTTATDALKSAFNLGAEAIPAEVMNMVTATKSSLTAEIANAGFSELGTNVTSGVAQGITEGTKEATTATTDMATGVSDAFKSEMDINSPSGVFKEFGGDTVDGYVLGVSDNVSKVKAAMTSLKAATIEAFSGLDKSFHDIGAQVMAGLNNGIANGSSKVVATARSVARQITASMKSELDINSPSRVAEKQVGRWVPEGVAVGIKKYAGTAYDAVSAFSSDLLSPIQPETALATGRMGMASIGSQIINNSYTQGGSNGNEQVTVKIPVNLDSRVIAESTVNNMSTLLNNNNETVANNNGRRRLG